MNRRNAGTRGLRKTAKGEKESHERCRTWPIEGGFGPVVKGFDQAGSGTPRERETVANDPDRAGVKRDNKRAAWAGRTMHTRRKNRRDGACSRESDLRRNLDCGGRNIEAGWSEGWLPRIAQHDLQTLKGTKPQERLSNDRPVVCPRCEMHAKPRRFNRSGPTNAAKRRPTKKGSAAR